MKIGIAQIQSITRKTSDNIQKHIRFIEKAIRFNVDIIVFPELSITNYETSLAKELAFDKDDKRFRVFQNLSDINNITVCVGVPIKYKEDITISMLIFQPKKKVLNYAKQLLHKDELPYFVCGNEQVFITIKNKKIAFGICYESMQKAHFVNACNHHSDIYIASVAKTEEGVQKGMIHYKKMSEEHQKTVIMVNTIGKADDFINAGQSAVFNNGKQIKQLNDTEESLLIVDTELNTTEIIA